MDQRVTNRSIESRTLDTLVRNAAGHLLTVQNKDGSFPAGHNGPYGHRETPIRNTAHVVCLLALLRMRRDDTRYDTRHDTQDDTRYDDAARRAIGYLLKADGELRPAGGTYTTRLSGGKDRCNGLIGQAWVIEALVTAAAAFDRPDCYDAAEALFLLHPRDARTAVWHRVEVDGTILSPDPTFNHQLWFAAAASLLHKTRNAREHVLAFLRVVASRVDQYRDGVLFHEAGLGSLTGYLGTGPRRFVSELRSRLRQRRKRADLYAKSVGYHGFNLYAYAMLHQAFPGESLWHTNRFRRMIRVCDKPTFQETLAGNAAEYGYRYNISGIEIAYALEELGFPSGVQPWLQRQLDQTCREPARPLCGGAADEATAAARIYQAARITGVYEVDCGRA